MRVEGNLYIAAEIGIGEVPFGFNLFTTEPPAGADLQSVPRLRKVWFSNLRIIYTAALLIMLVVRVC
ncbi:MAG: hypothetical protein KGZ82_07180 [Bacteroidales bacterium]|nr:hypothetical protein [Bacteroidales bacterium]